MTDTPRLTPVPEDKGGQDKGASSAVAEDRATRASTEPASGLGPDGRVSHSAECRNCDGERWVCENHQDCPWSPAGCECGAGAPCPVCNAERACAGFVEPLRDVLRAIAARAPRTKPDGPYDTWGGYISDNFGDVISAAKEEEAWDCAEIARAGLAARAAQWDGSAQRQDREAGLIGEADDSPVGSEADDAPTLHPNLPSPSGDRNTVLEEAAKVAERYKLRWGEADNESCDAIAEQIRSLKSDTPEPSGGQIELVAQRFSERASEAIHGMFDWEGVSDTLWEELTIKLYDVAAEELSAIAAIHPTPIGVSELADALSRAKIRSYSHKQLDLNLEFECSDDLTAVVTNVGVSSLRSQGGG